MIQIVRYYFAFFAVTSAFHHHLQAAEGFLELGLAHDANEALEDIEPELKTRAEVIAVRVGIYEFLKRWEEMVRHQCSPQTSG